MQGTDLNHSGPQRHTCTRMSHCNMSHRSMQGQELSLARASTPCSHVIALAPCLESSFLVVNSGSALSKKGQRRGEESSI